MIRPAPLVALFLAYSMGAYSQGIIATVAETDFTLQAGSYTGTIRITAPSATPQVSTVTVTFTVTAAQAPQLKVDKQSLSFPFPSKGSPRVQPVTVSNAGGGTLSFSAAAQTKTGGDWLSVSPGSGQVLPSAPVLLKVTANPTSLGPALIQGR